MVILNEIASPYGIITITREPDGTSSYRQQACLHSAINREGVSTCAYVHALYSILRQSGGTRMLIIGCAGGSLASMLHKDGCEVTVVDINPVSFSIARQYFNLPAQIRCVVQEGSAFIATAKDRYDAIAIDAFNSDGSIPGQFISEAFFAHVKRALTPRGVALMNIITLHDLDRRAHHVASHMKSAGLNAFLFDRPGSEHRNTIIAGGVANHVTLPSGREPAFIREKLNRLVRLQPIR